MGFKIENRPTASSHQDSLHTNIHTTQNRKAFGVDDGRILPIVGTIGAAFAFLFSTWSNKQDNEVRGGWCYGMVNRCGIWK